MARDAAREQAMADGYVQCDNCGHPIEDHIVSGCIIPMQDCECNVPWTVDAIASTRKRYGLKGAF